MPVLKYGLGWSGRSVVLITTVDPSSATAALPPKRAYAAGRVVVDDPLVVLLVLDDGEVVVADSPVHMVVSRAAPARSARWTKEVRVTEISLPVSARATRDTSADYR